MLPNSPVAAKTEHSCFGLQICTVWRILACDGRRRYDLVITVADAQPIIPEEPRPPREWQKARQQGVELSLDGITPAPGTPIYICADGVNHHTLVLLRATIRAMERTGQKAKLL